MLCDFCMEAFKDSHDMKIYLDCSRGSDGLDGQRRAAIVLLDRARVRIPFKPQVRTSDGVCRQLIPGFDGLKPNTANEPRSEAE
jgi:hypothetical protein